LKFDLVDGERAKFAAQHLIENIAKARLAFVHRLHWHEGF